jgi:hypothetical protein
MYLILQYAIALNYFAACGRDRATEMTNCKLSPVTSIHSAIPDFLGKIIEIWGTVYGGDTC